MISHFATALLAECNANSRSPVHMGRMTILITETITKVVPLSSIGYRNAKKVSVPFDPRTVSVPFDSPLIAL